LQCQNNNGCVFNELMCQKKRALTHPKTTYIFYIKKKMPHQNVYKSYNRIKTLMPIDHLQLINLNPHFFCSE